jgi:hypothetical protein
MAGPRIQAEITNMPKRTHTVFFAAIVAPSFLVLTIWLTFIRKKIFEERPQRDIKVPWSLWHGHPLVAPSHNFLRRVRGYIVKLIGKCSILYTQRS